MFIPQGILFKLALDVEKDGKWLYGGNVKNDEKGMKSATNELKGQAAFFNCRNSEIRYPLMALVHYKGKSTLCLL